MEYHYRRQPKRPEPQEDSLPEGLGEILKREIAREARERLRVDERVRTKWNEVVGPDLASRASPVEFSGGVLRVRVDSSALLGELAGIYKRELITALAEGERPVAVRDIKFELAGGERTPRGRGT